MAEAGCERHGGAEIVIIYVSAPLPMIDVSALLLAELSVEEQQQDSTEYGNQEALQVEAGNAAGTEEQTAEEATDDRAENANDDGDDPAAGVVARHDKFSDSACDEAENDPS